MSINSSIRGSSTRLAHLNSRISKFINDHILLVLLGPALVILAATFVYPVLWMFYKSLFITEPGIPTQFAPLYNYQKLFTSPEFWKYFKQSLFYSFGSLIISFSAGLAIALAINHIERNWLRNIYTTIILISWAIPLSVVALIWEWILQGSNFGLVNMILMDLGLINDPVIFFSLSLALPIVTLVDAWIRIPFAVIVLVAGLQAIPQHMYDAAKVDGATSFQSFRNITIPYLRPYIAIIALISWMFAFRTFSIIYPMTQGGPGTETTTISIFIFQEGIARQNFGFASATAAFLVVVTVILATFYVTVVLERVEE